MGHHIRIYKPYKEVPIFRDLNVVDGEQVYIGNGQNCGTFWFKNIWGARKFIDIYRDRITLTSIGGVRGLIPKELCENCKGHYSYGTPEWKKAKYRNCTEFKKHMKEAIGIR